MTRAGQRTVGVVSGPVHLRLRAATTGGMSFNVCLSEVGSLEEERLVQRLRQRIAGSTIARGGPGANVAVGNHPGCSGSHLTPGKSEAQAVLDPPPSGWSGMSRHDPGLEVASERDLYSKGMFLSCSRQGGCYYVRAAIKRNSRSELKWHVDAFAAHGCHGAVELGRWTIAHHEWADVPVNNRIMGAVGVALAQSGQIETSVNNEQSTRFIFLGLARFVAAVHSPDAPDWRHTRASDGREDCERLEAPGRAQVVSASAMLSPG